MRSIMKLTALAALLIVSVAVQNANAQMEFTVGGGLNAPQGDYGDQANTGYALETSLGYRFSRYAAGGVEVSYNGNKASDEVTAGLDPGYKLSSSILQYSAMAKALLPMGNHNVFAKGSVGNYRASAKASGPMGDASLTTTAFGFGLGAGFLINSSTNSSFFAEVMRHQVNFDNDGGDVSYFSVTVGALFKFDLFKESETERSAREELERAKH